ncbi:hypothetical protein LVB87_12645 [Lysobacter sp. KIS68-7]|uniref:TRAFAC clade GTPase domain-containing protein n=1 Tax=Lysobacter sp. KIS68-7 TaxID=2904252 RepID=UPI001E3FEF3C|nr:hypothetical protein [Lysobacter sp. KIS68-7]UHQ19023.1 hypothetical protein LVB87_12645 [Lysobacter sp. KIS68-7]
MSNDRSVVVIGLPASGKTTFLAALWHVITARDVETLLRFGGLRNGDVSYLNEIAARWRDARVQDRTALVGNRLVSMTLLDSEDETVRVTFPDLPGEAYRRMWEDRDCEPEVAETLRAGGVLLFVHADTIQAPSWVVDEVALAKKLGLVAGDDEIVEWHPRLSPTQVQLVDLLQLLRVPPLDQGARRLAVMFSAWDKAKGERLTPIEYLEQKMPLLAQYLRRNADGWDWRVFGVSAQGGDYEQVSDDAAPVPEAERLRNLDCASVRVQLVSATGESHDLTEPLQWLMG